MSPTEETTRHEQRRAPRLASDNLRATAAGGIALGITFAVNFVAGFLAASLLDLDRDDFIGLRLSVLTYFGFWIGYSLIFMAMTWRVFHRVGPELLAAWLQESGSARRRRRLREAFVAGSGPVGAVGFTSVAVGAVLVVAVVPELRNDPLVVGLAVGVVAVSWLLLVVSYAVHYAREEAHTRQLDFPGDAGPSLYDYVYLAVQISTTFSSSDVTVTGTSMRRTVSAHAVVAFAFNTVIIALLVSVLIAAIS